MTILFRKTSHWLLRNAMVYKIFFKEDTILTKSIYDKCANEINELITLAELTKDKNHIITVFDNPYKIEAPSGMIFPIEIEDVEAGFLCSSARYTGYSDYDSFKKDVTNNKFKSPNTEYLVYSTSQIGVDVERRSFVPWLCKEYNLRILTCDSYRLSLLMNKAHHFFLLKPLGHIPETNVYYGQKSLHGTIQSEYVILKPALECAAVGVKKIKNNDIQIRDEVFRMRNLYNQNIIIQEYIDGYEVSVPVINKGNKYISLPPVWVTFEGDILTYAAVDDFKYGFKVLPDSSFPYNDVIPKLLHHAEQIMSFLGTNGLIRVDYRIKNAEEYYVFDIAALPVLANTGTCMQSFKYLFDNQNSLFKAIIGSTLFQH